MTSSTESSGAAMREFDGGDRQTAIEEYPDVVGYTWDGDLFVIDKPLEILVGFDFRAYVECIEHLDVHRVPVTLSGKPVVLEVDPSADIAYLLEQVVSLDVFFDPGPADGGPASGAGFIFFLKEGFSYELAADHMAAVVAALRLDMASRA